jgi:DtxR family transcriptional regulator, iron-dependent repressor
LYDRDVTRHPPVEEYLETVLELGEDGVTVTQARVADRLHHSAPTVSQMVRRLVGDGYLSVSNRVLSLTPKGRTEAERVVRKHRLAERLLTDVIGLGWDKAHEEAGRWEHVISDEVEVLLVRLLGNPSTCPHGNPIPGAGVREPALAPLASLADCSPGDRVRLQRVTEQVEIDQEALSYLADNGFTPGAAAEVRTRADDGSLVLEIDERTVEVGPRLAGQLFVEAAAPA